MVDLRCFALGFTDDFTCYLFSSLQNKVVIKETRKDARWERTRQSLLDGGRKVFSEVGVEATSVLDIVRAAGVSQPSFYNHFATKDELALEIAAAFFRNDRKVKQAIFDQIDDPAQAIAINVGQTLDVVRQDPVVAWVLVRSESLRTLLLSSDNDPLARMIREGIKVGRFAETTEQLSALAIRGAAVAMVKELLGGNAQANAIQEFQELVLRLLGLTAGEAKKVVILARKRFSAFESAAA